MSISAFRKRAARAQLLIVLTATGVLAASACGEPFSSCEDLRNCPEGGMSAGAATGASGAEERGGAVNATGGASEGAAAGRAAGGEAGAGATRNEEQGGNAGSAGAIGTGGVAAQGGQPQSVADAGADAGGESAIAGTAGTSSVESCTPGTVKTCADIYGEGDACDAHSITCLGDGTWPAQALACVAGVRDCTSRFDNDCDGTPDNTIDEVCQCVPGATKTCFSHTEDGHGDCTAGQQLCVPGNDDLSSSSWGECEGSVGPQSEVCGNGRDEDCNDLYDDGCECTPGDIESCGVCGSGSQTCGDDGNWGACKEGECEDCPTAASRFSLTDISGTCCIWNSQRGEYSPMATSKYMYTCKYD